MSKLILVWAPLALCLSACGGRYPLANVGAVSMTHRSVDSGAQTTSLGEIEAQFCAGDDEPLVADGNNVGLMDEAIMAAQKKSGADFLVGANFYTSGSCVIVKGEGRKIGGAAPPVAAPEASEAPPPTAPGS